MTDLRLTFGWAGSPGFRGLLSSAAEHAHCNTFVSDAHILSKGEDMMSHVTIVEPYHTIPRPDPPREGAAGSVFCNCIRWRLHTSQSTARSLGPNIIDRVGLPSIRPRTPVWPGGEGEIPILSPKKSTNWYTTVDALGYTINSHTMSISIAREKVAAVRDLLQREWPSERAEASAQEALRTAGTLWNLTFVVRAGRYFVWQLLRITDFHSSAAKSSRKRSIVQLGREFHGDLAFWKWAISRRLVQTRESLSAPFYAHSKRRPVRRYLSDAIFSANGGYCPELKIFWIYTLDARLTAELKRKAETKEASAITIILLELAGMFMMAWVVQMIVGDRLQTAGDVILLCGDNVSAVSWVNKCGGAKDRRAGLLMRLLGRMEFTCEWCHIAKHIPGLDNTLADGISRWPEDKVHET